MTRDEALKLALEALESMKHYVEIVEPGLVVTVPAIAAIREMLAHTDYSHTTYSGFANSENAVEQPKPTRHVAYVCPQCHWTLDEQPQQKPVATGSLEHLKLMMEASAWDGRLQLEDALANIDDFAKEQPQQEPAAWMVESEDGRHFIFRTQKPVIHEGETLTSLYTTLPRSEWRGLTDDEVRAEWVKVIDPSGGDEVMALARAIEAKLKEKNQ